MAGDGRGRQAVGNGRRLANTNNGISGVFRLLAVP